MSFIRIIDVKKEISKRNFVRYDDNKPYYIPKGKRQIKGDRYTSLVYHNQGVLWKLKQTYTNPKVKKVCIVGLYYSYKSFLDNEYTQEEYCLFMLDVFDYLNEITKRFDYLVEGCLTNTYKHLKYVRKLKGEFKKIDDKVDYYQKDFEDEIKEFDYHKRKVGNKYWIEKPITGRNYIYTQVVDDTQKTLYSIMKDYEKDLDYKNNKFICKSCLMGLIINYQKYNEGNKLETHSYIILTILKNLDKLVNVKHLIYKWKDFIEEVSNGR